MQLLIILLAVIAIVSLIQWIRCQTELRNYKSFIEDSSKILDKEDATTMLGNLTKFNYGNTRDALVNREKEFNNVMDDIQKRVIETVSNYTESINNLLSVINSFSNIKSKKVVQVNQETNDQVLYAISKYRDVATIWEGMFEIVEGKKDETRD